MAGVSPCAVALLSLPGMGSAGKDPEKLFSVRRGERANAFSETHGISQLTSFS